MDKINQTKLDPSKVCDLCKLHDPLVKNYAEDYDLQTALRDYVEKATGERINVVDIAHLCDSCYAKVSDNSEDVEE